MLEALAHQQLKALLRLEGETRWPHHLTLSRLAARSLRRADQTLVRLAPGSDPSWLLALLGPIALTDTGLALVVSAGLRQRLLQVELPRLEAAGLTLPCWEGPAAPPQARLWLLDHGQLVQAWRTQGLGDRQLVIPEAENLELLLRSALGLVIENHDWEVLRRSLPGASAGLLGLHERLSRRIFAHPQGPVEQVGVSPEEEAPLRQLLGLMEALPEPWPQWLACGGSDWVSASCASSSLMRCAW
jgi:ATP-dependent DNA helicase DinG